MASAAQTRLPGYRYRHLGLMLKKLSLKTLPCDPCPHKGACCSWGTSVSFMEKANIQLHHGEDSVVWSEDEQEWRTAVVNGRCFFWKSDGTCKIHGEPYYPRVCRLFPYEDEDDGGPYKYDLGICPELRSVVR